jgi:hypothetical protein
LERPDLLHVGGEAPRNGELFNLGRNHLIHCLV